MNQNQSWYAHVDELLAYLRENGKYPPVIRFWGIGSVTRDMPIIMESFPKSARHFWNS